MDEMWDEVDDHLTIIHGNLGICCQEYCDAPNAIHSLERVTESLANIRYKLQKNGTV